ncbi:MAG: InlB B-repeat-containing protein, partial [Clostridia bacterium]|nr:InlB B-repeat-containing protein [Clostridia bacterium]
MRDKISLSSKKSRIALTLVLILLLQIIMPIMKVEAVTYKPSTLKVNTILKGGDIIDVAGYVHNDYDSGYNKYTVPAGYHLVTEVWSAPGIIEFTDIDLNLVTLNANGGSVSNSTMLIKGGHTYGRLVPTTYTSYATGVGLPTPNSPSSDYSFDGWYTAATGGVKVENSSICNGNTTLYAHWVQKDATYSVNENLVYNGQEQTGVTGNNVTITEYQKTDAGNYTATVTPEEGHAWEDDGTTTAKTVNWSISPVSIDVVWGDPTTFTYDKQGHAPAVTTPVDGVNGEKVNIERTTEINQGNYVSTASISSVTGGRENKNNYVLSNNTQSFSINAKSLFSDSVSISALSEGTFTYDGTEHKPTVTIKDYEHDDSVLVQGTDYTITYENNINAGNPNEAKAIITGIGNYGGEIVKTFTINKRPVTVKVDENQSKVFGDTEPTLTATENDVVSGDTLNYTIARETGENAGTYPITITLGENPNYNVTKTDGTFTIERKPINVRIETENEEYKYIAGENEPEITVYNTADDSKVNTSEYNVTYSNNDNVGTATIKVTDNGTGNYIVANAEKNFTIINGDITDEMLKFEDNMLNYDGEEHQIRISGELPGGTIEYSTDGENFSETLPTYTDAGEYTIYYRAKKENYNDKVGSKTLTINKKVITEKEIVSIENQVYTGEKVEPEIVIKDGENIVPNTEYTVEYSNNIKPGIANVTIKNVDGGNYIVETTELTFVIIEPGTVDYIEPKTPNANNAKVTETPEEVIAKINLTDEDVDNIKHGKNIDVYLEVKDISNSVSNSDKKAIEEKLGKSNLGLYLDVSLFKKVTGEEATKILETKEPITISFELPDELINKNSKVERSYKILRLHEGSVEELDVKVDGKTATFETDKFSTYALTYTDVEKTSSPKTGDNITM